MFKQLAILVALLLLCVPASAKPHPRIRRLIPRVWDKRFWIATGIQTAAVIADVETTMAARNRQDLVESNPLAGKKPGRLELYSIEGGLEGVVLWSEYTLKKMSTDGSEQNRSLYHALVVIQTGVHTGSAIHNAIVLSGPTGVPTTSGVHPAIVFSRAVHICPASGGCR
ncbi:MAG TPA: hypothetical protein VGR72_13835 [Candidatus Acidoferrales bacterium]|nr:hypothetical protein [Candidatus Acidoferrales bacterium]